MDADISMLVSVQEIALAAFGALAVAQCHLQLAKQRVEAAGDRIANDHIDTAIVFTDSATAVIASINEMIDRAKHKNEERERKIRTA